MNSRRSLVFSVLQTGIIMRDGAHYFIEPLKGHRLMEGDPHPHVVYKAAHIGGKNTPSAKEEDMTEQPSAYCSANAGRSSMSAWLHAQVDCRFMYRT